MLRSLSLLAVLVLAGTAALAPPASAQGYGQVVRCESYDFRDNYCPADTRPRSRYNPDFQLLSHLQY